MGFSPTKLASAIWRAYITAGLPSSGAYKPKKSEIRTWGGEVEAALTVLNGAIGGTESVKTADYTVLVTDDGTTLVGNSSSTITFTLPAVATAGAKFQVRVFNIGSGSLIVDGNGAETINGSASTTLGQYESAVLWTEGTTWRSEQSAAASGSGGSAFALLDDYISGAYVDENTDVSSALTAALATGKIVIGTPDRVYGINGNVNLGSVFRVHHVKIKQLDPDQTNRRTLYSAACLYGELFDVTVDINSGGAFAGGAIPAIDDGNAGMRITCTTDGRVQIVGCEIKNGGFGNGIFLANSYASRISGCWIHDFYAGSASYATLSDDVIQGIHDFQNTSLEISNNRIETFHTEWSGQAEWARFTRGIAGSGGGGSNIFGNTLDDIDQPIDISGNLNPVRFKIHHNTITDGLSLGIKCANSVRDAVIHDNYIDRTGIWGIVLSAPSASMATNGITLDECTGNCRVHHNIVKNAGYLNFGTLASTTSGIAVLTNHSDYVGYPRGVYIEHNTILGNSDASMEYGVYNNATYGGDPANQASRNEVSDANTANQTGFVYPACDVYLSSAQTFSTSGATEAINWNAENYDGFGMHNTGTNPERLLAREDGLYLLSFALRWASDPALGGAYIYVNGSLYGNGFFQGKDIAGSRVLSLNAGDYVEVRGRQDSGGSLDLQASYTWASLVKLGADKY